MKLKLINPSQFHRHQSINRGRADGVVAVLLFCPQAHSPPNICNSVMYNNCNFACVHNLRTANVPSVTQRNLGATMWVVIRGVTIKDQLGQDSPHSINLHTHWIWVRESVSVKYCMEPLRAELC